VLKIFIATLLLSAVCFAQQKQEPDKPETKTEKPGRPQVKINYLNVCTPSPDERTVLDNALSTLPSKPAFGTEFEVARGRSSMPEEGPGAVQGSAPTGAPPPVSTWVRIRREFAVGELDNVQYTFSRDGKAMTETLVFRMKSPKRDQPMQVSIQNAVTAPTAAQALAAEVEPERIRIERFGGSSVVLARCPQADQKQYEPYFTRAKTVMMSYRRLLGVKATVPADLARVTTSKIAVSK
jgi:hypothetical protein